MHAHVRTQARTYTYVRTHTCTRYVRTHARSRTKKNLLIAHLLRFKHLLNYFNISLYIYLQERAFSVHNSKSLLLIIRAAQPSIAHLPRNNTRTGRQEHKDKNTRTLRAHRAGRQEHKNTSGQEDKSKDSPFPTGRKTIKTSNKDKNKKQRQRQRLKPMHGFYVTRMIARLCSLAAAERSLRLLQGSLACARLLLGALRLF